MQRERGEHLVCHPAPASAARRAQTCGTAPPAPAVPSESTAQQPQWVHRHPAACDAAHGRRDPALLMPPPPWLRVKAARFPLERRPAGGWVGVSASRRRGCLSWSWWWSPRAPPTGLFPSDPPLGLRRVGTQGSGAKARSWHWYWYWRRLRNADACSRVCESDGWHE
jgi:hypothetical protein